MKPPCLTEVWISLCKSGIGNPTRDMLADGQTFRAMWTPPATLRPIPAGDAIGPVDYQFRLHFQEGEGKWYIDGTTEGQNGWLPVSDGVYTDDARKAVWALIFKGEQA